LAWSLEQAHYRSPIGFHFQSADQKNKSDAIDPVVLKGSGHVTTVAPTGTGKGVSCIIPNLLQYNGQAIVIDPKGENYAVTAKQRRAMGQRVVLLDPFNVTQEKNKDTFNLLDLISIQSNNKLQVLDDSLALANILMECTSEKDIFWDEAAKQLVGALIGSVAIHHGEVRHLPQVCKQLFSDSFSLLTFLNHLNIKTEGMFDGLMGLLDEAPDRTRASIFTVARQQLLPFYKGLVANDIKSTSFSLADFIAGKPMTIYFVLPPDKLESHKSLLRLWVGCFIRLLLKRTSAPQLPTLMMLDEAAQLGSLDELVQAVTLLRGYGLQVWSFWQDLEQIESCYPKKWKTILNNSKAIQAFGIPNVKAANQLMDITGFNANMTLLDLDRDEMLLQMAGDEGILAQKINYLSDPLFNGLYDKNPFHSFQDSQGFVPVKPQRIYSRKSDTDNKVKVDELYASSSLLHGREANQAGELSIKIERKEKPKE